MKTTEQHLTVRSGKSEAEATIIKDCARDISGVATGEGKGAVAPTLFKPDFQIRANPVRNLNRVGVG